MRNIASSKTTQRGLSPLIGLRTYARLIFAAVIVATLLLIHQDPALSSDGSIPKHVPTWAYDGGYGGLTDGSDATHTNPISQHHIQTWLSFAEAGIQANGLPQKAYYDCPPGAPCKNVIYFDPGKLYANCWPDKNFISANTSEDYYLHDGPPTFDHRLTKTQREMGRAHVCT